MEENREDTENKESDSNAVNLADPSFCTDRSHPVDTMVSVQSDDAGKETHPDPGPGEKLAPIKQGKGEKPTAIFPLAKADPVPGSNGHLTMTFVPLLSLFYPSARPLSHMI